MKEGDTQWKKVKAVKKSDKQFLLMKQKKVINSEWKWQTEDKTVKPVWPEVSERRAGGKQGTCIKQQFVKDVSTGEQKRSDD